MTPTTWTPARDTWLRAMFATNASQELANTIGCTVGALRKRASTLGLLKTPEWRAQNSRDRTLARSQWRPELLEILDLMYVDMRTQDLADLIGIPLSRVHAMANARGLRKSPELVRQMARDRMTPDHPAGLHQFKKGIRPWNTGHKGINYPGMVATQFKPGGRPHTWKPIGSTRVMDGYLQRKVTETGYPPRDWKPVHVLLWEETHSPVLTGYAVAFKDGNRQHITLDNLELLSRAELMRRNSVHTVMPPELRYLVQLRAVLTRQIHKQERASS